MFIDTENSEIKSKAKSPVAVKITFQNAAHWRKHEAEIRSCVNKMDGVKVVVGEYKDENQ